jgi:hypothetical protein
VGWSLPQDRGHAGLRVGAMNNSRGRGARTVRKSEGWRNSVASSSPHSRMVLVPFQKPDDDEEGANDNEREMRRWRAAARFSRTRVLSDDVLSGSERPLPRAPINECVGGAVGGRESRAPHHFSQPHDRVHSGTVRRSSLGIFRSTVTLVAVRLIF